VYEWIDCGNGRQVYRKVDRTERAVSDLPRPMVISDSIEPCVSMADGRQYSSKAALRATYRPSGNPTGESFTEIGNEKLPTPVRKEPIGVRESIQRAKEKLGI
jgi:hypothetical protein